MCTQAPCPPLPPNYVLELDNTFVRVTRVRYSPGDKLPEHSHSAQPTVYVYLTDGGSIRFLHKKPTFTIERPPVKAGSVRFNRNAQQETHETEYLGDSASEYLRIELKTEPGPPHPDARLRSAADFPWEDEQVRISRAARNAPRSKLPAVIVDLDSRSFRWSHPSVRSTPLQRARNVIKIELKTGPKRKSSSVR